jgi:hypothetical protein
MRVVVEEARPDGQTLCGGKHMRALVTSISIASLLLVVPSSDVHACSCISGRPVCEAFGTASAVFIGRVVGGKQQNAWKNEDGTTTVYDVGEIELTIDEAFSGVKGLERVTIYSGTNSGNGSSSLPIGMVRMR